MSRRKAKNNAKRSAIRIKKTSKDRTRCSPSQYHKSVLTRSNLYLLSYYHISNTNMAIFSTNRMFCSEIGNFAICGRLLRTKDTAEWPCLLAKLCKWHKNDPGRLPRSFNP